jgi:hypothetical protein
VSRTTIDKRGIPGGYLAAQSAAQLRERLPSLLEASLREQTNLIIRPHIRQPAGLLQFDDLSVGMLARLQPLAFLVIATSAEKRQAWVTLEGCDPDFCRRVKRAAGADLGANGNVRLAGSLNVKSVYSPDFPTVRIEATLSRPRVGPEDFRALGLVAPAEAGGGVYSLQGAAKRQKAESLAELRMLLGRRSCYSDRGEGQKPGGFLLVLHCHPVGLVSHGSRRSADERATFKSPRTGRKVCHAHGGEGGRSGSW